MERSHSTTTPERAYQTTVEDLEQPGRHFVGLWSTDQPNAAGFLGIAKGTVYQAARNGDLPTIRVGHLWKVPTAALLAMAGRGEAS